MYRCEADPDVLAKYVLALLRHDKESELEAHCIEQLRDFLKDETERFVKQLFRTLEGSVIPRNFLYEFLFLNIFIKLSLCIDGSYANAVDDDDDKNDNDDYRKHVDVSDNNM